MVFEDMQWADQGLLEFIEQLLEWSTSVPIFMLTLARPELGAKHEGWPAGRRGTTLVTLEPLDEAAMCLLLSSVVDALPPDALARVVERAQGVPLYAIETVRALQDRGTLVSRDRRLVATGELGELEVPASLNALLASRLDALEPSERELVRALSVFGGSFPRHSAVALSELDGPDVERALAGLVRKQVLVIRADPLSPERGQYAFVQGMLRTVAYGMLSRKERKQRHLATAEHLEQAFPDQGEEVAEVIAAHRLDAYRAARDTDPDTDRLRGQAVQALKRSARRAAAVGAPDSARRAYEQAAEIAGEGDRAGLLQAAGEMALRSGRSEDAVRLLDTAAGLYERAGREREQALTAYAAGAALRHLGRLQEAIERLTRGLEALGPAEGLDPDIGRLSAMLGRAFAFAGEYERAVPVLETALTVAQALELPDVLAEALNNKAMLYQYTGRPQEAKALFAAGVEIAERHDVGDLIGRAQSNLANLASVLDLPDAGAQTEAALATARRRGDRASESVIAGNLMAVHLYAGRWDELERLANELLDDDRDRPGTEDLHYRLALLHTHRGEPDAAAATLERLTGWADHDDLETRSMYDACVIATRLAQDRPADALGTALAMLPKAIETLGAWNDAIRDGWPLALTAALQLGRHDDVRTILELLAGRPPGLIPPYLRAHLARGHALLAAAQGDPDTVEHDVGGATTPSRSSPTRTGTQSPRPTSRVC